LDEAKLPRQQNAGKKKNRHTDPQCKCKRHAPRLTRAACATSKHEVQGGGEAGENGKKCEAYKVGHNRDYLLNLKRKFYLITAAALFLAVLGIYLGFWQLGRAAQKEAIHAAMQAQALQTPLDAAALAQLPDTAAGLYRPVQVEGRWESAHTVFLDNRQMDTKVGFFVVTPLRVEATGQIVLVQRGWVGRNFAVRDQVPAVQTPAGLVWVEGQIAPPPSKLYEPGAPGLGLIRQNIDLDKFRLESGLVLANFAIRQNGPPSDGLRREWSPVALGVEKHYGYAFQWFALAALVFGLYLWFHFFRRPTARFQETHPHVPPPSQ
jgi:surfeit locus 1 family protein